MDDARHEVVDAKMTTGCDREEAIEAGHQLRLFEVHVVPDRRHFREAHLRARGVQVAPAVSQAFDKDEPATRLQQFGDVLNRALLQIPALEIDETAHRERDVEGAQCRWVEIERVADLETQVRLAGSRGPRAVDHRLAEIDAERLADTWRQQARRVAGAAANVDHRIGRAKKRLDCLDLEPALPDVGMRRFRISQ